MEDLVEFGHADASIFLWFISWFMHCRANGALDSSERDENETLTCPTVDVKLQLNQRSQERTTKP